MSEVTFEGVEAFFVCHGGDVGYGSELKFTKNEAFATDFTYIDVFDETGKWIGAYKAEDVDGKTVYTTDF